MPTAAATTEIAAQMPAAVPPPAPAGGPSGDKVIIIGGGIAGLSCGCYLQMNGISTEILELSDLPGGLCTAWHRGPYVFDGCLRWLIGTQPPSAFHQIWQELGAIAGRRVLVHDEILTVEDAAGNKFVVPANLDDLAREFKRIAPEDGKLIDRLVRDARNSAGLEPPLEKPLELMSGREKMRVGLKYLPMVPIVFRWKNLPITTYLARYKSPFLREVFQAIAGNEHMSALVLVMVLAFRTRNNTGFVAGGSWDFAMAIADRYTRLGGTLRFKTRVTGVTVDQHRATGVTCADGTALSAATVVSCADGYTTIFKMLDGRYVDKKIRYLYDHCRTFPAILQISLGIRKVFPDAPHTLNLPLTEPLAVDDQVTHPRLEVETFGAESALCPEGTSVMTVRLPTSHEYWMELKKTDATRYRAEKKKILRTIIDILDRRFPGLAQHVDRFDVATPATYVRYTGNWQGSYEGWLPTPRILGRRIESTLPGLKNFYMAGHWVVAGGGLPSAALSGRYVAQMICAARGKNFVVTKPQL
ncbi:MAG TPA: NAD(P)/FAD-dependent oxidoreductase [Dongiaceae bacterium]|jgi:phytoene dehydrogenase-like protein|nr:NAD(P)/FAD-dependent oxidoreductase [Dongiaceae bacterium]